MRTETRAAVRAVLQADPSIPKTAIVEILHRISESPRAESQPEFLSVTEAAHTTSTSRWTIRRWIKSGRLKAVRIHGVVRIPRSAIHELLG